MPFDWFPISEMVQQDERLDTSAQTYKPFFNLGTRKAIYYTPASSRGTQLKAPS